MQPDREEMIERGEIQPPKGMNWMEEQYVKYGNNLGNYHPAPIVGTDSMASVYKSHNLTPDEYQYFKNWRGSKSHGDDRKMMKKYKPKGISYKLHGDRFHQASVLEDKERLTEFSRRHGTTSANQIRNQNRPDLAANEGNFSNTFLSSG
jgi:hypothetical protein